MNLAYYQNVPVMSVRDAVTESAQEKAGVIVLTVLHQTELTYPARGKVGA